MNLREAKRLMIKMNESRCYHIVKPNPLRLSRKTFDEMVELLDEEIKKHNNGYGYTGPAIQDVAYILLEEPETLKDCCQCDHCQAFFKAVKDGLNSKKNKDFKGDLQVECRQSIILLDISDAKKFRDMLDDDMQREALTIYVNIIKKDRQPFLTN